MNDYNLYKIKANTLNTLSNLVENSIETVYGLDFSKRYNIKKMENFYWYNPNIVTQNGYASDRAWVPQIPSLYAPNKGFYIINNKQKDLLLNINTFLKPMLISDVGSKPILFYGLINTIDYNALCNYLEIPPAYDFGAPIMIYGPNKPWTASHFFDNSLLGRLQDTTINNRLNFYNFDENITNISYCFSSQRYMRFIYNFPSSPNITNMSHAYTSCQNIRGSAYCPPNVIDFSHAFSGCWNLTGTPVCSDKVVNMSYAYQSCSNITGAAAVGSSVVNMSGAYSGSGITSINIGPNVVDISTAFSSCNKISSSINFDGIDYHNVKNAYMAFYNTKTFRGVPADFPAQNCSEMGEGSSWWLLSGQYSFGKYAVNVAYVAANRTIETYSFPQIQTPTTTDYCINWFRAFAARHRETKHWGTIYVTNGSAYLNQIINNRYTGPVEEWLNNRFVIYACEPVFERLSQYGYNYLDTGQKTGLWNTKTSSTLEYIPGQVFVYKI